PRPDRRFSSGAQPPAPPTQRPPKPAREQPKTNDANKVILSCLFNQAKRKRRTAAGDDPRETPARAAVFQRLSYQLAGAGRMTREKVFFWCCCPVFCEKHRIFASRAAPRPGAVARFGLPFPSAFIIPRAAARGRRRGRAERLRIPWTRAMIEV